MEERFSRFRKVLRPTFARFLLAQARLRPRPLRYLFILGHIRSGSSLLVHLLNSHREICALGESWLTYDSKDRLNELMVLVHLALKKPLLRETYVADKILHDELLESDEILRSPGLRFIFLLREPERSLLSMVAHRERLKIISDWQSALTYYEKRLTRLAAQARVIGDKHRSFLLLYERLVSDSRASLDATAAFLGLRSPLSSAYSVGPHTGIAGLGDFSEHIMSGRIIVTPPPALRVPDDVLVRARSAYEACIAVLAKVCTTL
jgi:Sulfotransferase domain